MGPAGGPSNVKIGIFSAIRLYFRRLSQMMGRVVQAMSDEIRGAFAESVSRQIPEPLWLQAWDEMEVPRGKNQLFLVRDRQIGETRRIVELRTRGR